MLEDDEIEKRLVALRAAHKAKGRGLTEDEFAAMFGPAQVRSDEARDAARRWVPKCTEQVLKAAASLCDSRDRVRASDVAARIGVSAETALKAMKVLKEQGRWPYAEFQDRKSRTYLRKQAG